MSRREIWVVPFFGQGHLFPCMELCKHIAASRDFQSTLIISPNLSTSIPSSLRQHPHIQVIEIQPSIPPPPSPQPASASASDPIHQHRKHHELRALALQNLLSTRPGPKPVCAVLDTMMGWSTEVFAKFHIPTVAFFTSGACSAAIECATWKFHIELDSIKPGETRLLPGLPEDMALTYSDLKRRPHGPPGGPPPPLSGGPPPQRRPFRGPPKPGNQPQWVEEVEGVMALLINTCDDLESPFIRYLSDQIGKPVWGVGPLLPEQYWKSAAAGSLLHDRELRTNNRKSNVTEDEVIQWLDSKPSGSVLYVSFGTEVGPTMEEYPQLADALLESSSTTFIWVIQPGSGRSGTPRALLGGQPGSEEEEEVGYFPHGLHSKVGNRGLIIRGWAPQLLILSHPSTAGFLSHCGWNSTVEAIGRGVPILAWPIRGDQIYDAKLVVSHLKVGNMISDDLSQMVQKEDIVKGIEKLMGDEDMKSRAHALSTKFLQGFPTSSVTALDAFRDFIIHKAAVYNRDEDDLESGTRNSSNMALGSIFFAITVESTSTIVALSLDVLSPLAKKLFTGVLVTNLVGFLCLFVALSPSRYISGRTAKILGKVGGAAAAFGFLLMMVIQLSLWIIIPASVVVLAASVSSLSTEFLPGFPTSSVTALDPSRDFINHEAA